MLPAVSVNYLAILVTAIVSIFIGSTWYSPAVFGKMWMQSMNVTPKDIQKAKKKGMAKSYLIAFIGALVTSYVLAHFVGYTSAGTFLEGMQTGFWIWLGFAAPLLLGNTLWEGRPWNMYLINASYHLVNLIIAGGILAIWQ